MIWRKFFAVFSKILLGLTTVFIMFACIVFSATKSPWWLAGFFIVLAAVIAACSTIPDEK